MADDVEVHHGLLRLSASTELRISGMKDPGHKPGTTAFRAHTQGMSGSCFLEAMAEPQHCTGAAKRRSVRDITLARDKLQCTDLVLNCSAEKHLRNLRESFICKVSNREPVFPAAENRNFVDELQRRKNRTKAQVRSKVEHVFRVVKRQFGFDWMRYRGLAKNANRMFSCFALVNLYITRKRLAPSGA
jgi:hypothetical protein